MLFEGPKKTSARISGANDTQPRWCKTSPPKPLTILTNSLNYQEKKNKNKNKTKQKRTEKVLFNKAQNVEHHLSYPKYLFFLDIIGCQCLGFRYFILKGQRNKQKTLRKSLRVKTEYSLISLEALSRRALIFHFRVTF